MISVKRRYYQEKQVKEADLSEVKVINHVKELNLYEEQEGEINCIRIANQTTKIGKDGPF